MPRIRLLIADDHPIVSEGLSFILKDHFDVVGMVGDGHAMVEATRRLQPDVIIADVSMPLLNGVDALREIRREGLQSKVLILTMHKDAALAQDAFRAGASGFLLKASPSEELVSAIHEVAAGRAYILRSSPKI